MMAYTDGSRSLSGYVRMEYVLFRIRNLPYTPVQKYFLFNTASLDEEWHLLETHRAVLRMTSKPLLDAILEPH